jgi:CRISPR type III-B/RAMP module RAMP protein Cmr6
MNAVLTKSVQAALNAHRRCDSWTLRLDKLSFPEDTRGSWKFPALNTVVKEFKIATADLSWLARLRNRHQQHYREFKLYNITRLAMALGRASVLENVGLAANPITGLPIIPGSSLKGLLATWICWRGNTINPDQQDQPLSFRDNVATDRRSFLDHTRDLALRILGSDDPEHPAAGEIIFVGAFPVVNPSLKLEVEVLTPHTTGQPVPSFFLTIAPGAAWRFIIIAKETLSADWFNILDATEALLKEALTQIGIGAKTAAGYGRFDECTSDSPPAQQHPKPGQREKAPTPQFDVEADYPNETVFRNRVLSKLNPGQLHELKPEVQFLQKEANRKWRERFQQLLASPDYRDIRKRLQKVDWFPKDLLPNH